ncbi:unnamed protein product [Rhizopus stolonifer]
MCDTNWCTFCDCAVSPQMNTIYCSEKCFRKDAQDLSLFRAGLNTASLLYDNTYDQRCSSNSSSSSIVYSDDLATIYLDSMSSRTISSSSGSAISSQSIEPHSRLNKLAGCCKQ